MSQLKSSQLETVAEAIVEEYPTDFTQELVSEFRSFVNEFRKEIAERQSVTGVIRLMLESRVSSSFSQVYKLLILFATIPVTVATAERSFSKLKLIKTYLRQCPSCITSIYMLRRFSKIYWSLLIFTSKIFIYLKTTLCKHRHAIVDLRLDSACAFALLKKKSGVPGDRSFT
jgi:hypothetical protein